MFNHYSHWRQGWNHVWKYIKCTCMYIENNAQGCLFAAILWGILETRKEQPSTEQVRMWWLLVPCRKELGHVGTGEAKCPREPTSGWGGWRLDVCCGCTRSQLSSVCQTVGIFRFLPKRLCVQMTLPLSLLVLWVLPFGVPFGFSCISSFQQINIPSYAEEPSVSQACVGPGEAAGSIIFSYNMQFIFLWKGTYFKI